MTPNLDHRRTDVKARSGELGSSREQLLMAAARVFAREGYSGASIAQIAAESGFSKGAVYWNFSGKQDLFFALLDQADERLRALLVLVSTTPLGGDVWTEVSRGLAAVLDEQRDLVALFHEYSALAVRDPELRARYAKRNAALRAELSELITARQKERGVSLKVSPERIATALIALVVGLSIERLTEPEAVPDEIFGQILALLEDGNSARSGAPK